MFIVDLAALLAVVAVVTECQSTGYEPPFGCTGTEITDTDRGDVLFAINDLRQRVAQGQEIGLNFASLPASNEMYKMKYDCDLEELAKQAVDGCPATPAPPPSHGMNVAKVPASQTPGYDAFDGWYIQSENVQIPPTAAMIASYSEFLNMVVGTSYALGCSKAACPGTSDEMVACVFQAPQVKDGDEIYKTSPLACTPTDGCTDLPSTCTDDLCVVDFAALTTTSTTTPTTTASTTTTPTTTTTTTPTTTTTTTTTPTTTTTTTPTTTTTTTTPTTTTTTTTPTTTTTTTTPTTTTTRPTTTTTTTTTRPTTTTTTTRRPTTTTTINAHPNPSVNQWCPANGDMNDRLRDKALMMHNYRRSQLAKGLVPKFNGNLLPSASNMMKLKYDCDLEKAAKIHSDRCDGESDPATRPGIGENIATVAKNEARYRINATEIAIKRWWHRIKTETESIGMAVTFKAHHVSLPIRKFTMMAWATTTKLGCGVTICATDYKVVCRYQPGGNIVNQRIYLSGPPCARCPAGTTCEDSLCRSP